MGAKPRVSSRRNNYKALQVEPVSTAWNITIWSLMTALRGMMQNVWQLAITRVGGFVADAWGWRTAVFIVGFPGLSGPPHNETG